MTQSNLRKKILMEFTLIDYNDSISKGLWNTLMLSQSFETDSTVYISGKVQLRLDDKTLNAKLLNKSDGKLIEELNLEGRIKGDYFTIDRKFSLIPLFPIFFVNKETKTIIRTDKNNDLVVLSGKVNELISILWAGGQKEHIITDLIE